MDVREWLETDGLGGFASGTASGVRTRRYHGILIAAATPPTGRMMLVNGFDAWIDVGGTTINLSTQRYLPDVLHPDGIWRFERFVPNPWPTWRWRINDDVDVIQELFVTHGAPRVVLRWHLSGPLEAARLSVRPFLSGRDCHSLHQENAAFNFDAAVVDGRVDWRPYPDVPGICSRSNGEYRHDPVWYRQFLYLEERNRGLDDVEDLASPGILTWDLGSQDPVWVLEASSAPRGDESAAKLAARLRDAEIERRRSFPTVLHRSADQYIVKRGSGCSIIAGYPWFTDWGRDTFIALRGLCLATGRLGDARRILLQWSDMVSDGMLPNRFCEADAEPEFNSVDASLWFIIAVRDLFAASARGRELSAMHRQRMTSAVDEILSGYSRGTRFGIHADADGLIAAGVPGVQLTWMDARVGGDVVTPRIGKPVEVQALWINALQFGGQWSTEWKAAAARAAAAFTSKFWNPGRGCLYDVIDVDHVSGRVDDRLRPNQILAVGGLPAQLLAPERARSVVDLLEYRLLTPLGLRTLAPGDQGYAPRCQGDVWARDHAYHQGTVWPWLMGPFVDAWVRVRGDTPAVRREAADRFVRPLLGQLNAFGLGHLPEIADAEEPFTPRGCPFQAWSVGELLRLTESRT